MKQKLLAISALLFIGQTAQAQSSGNAAPAGGAVYTYVEQMPVFPGGQTALLQAVGEKTYYPTEALQQRLEGRVFVHFVVGTSGQVQDVKVAGKGVHPLLDAEAVRAVSALPAFSPGRQVGQAVPVAFTLPITFKLPPNVEEILAARANPASTSITSDMARFPGGSEALLAYLASAPYPEAARATQAEGRVFVHFQVSASGKVEQVAAIMPAKAVKRKNASSPPPFTRTSDPVLIKAAEQLVAAMPAWKPALIKGVPVASNQTVLVDFHAAGSATATPPVYAYAEQMPVFSDPRGESAHLGLHIQYPVSALRSRTQGVVLVYYEVSEEGKVENAEVIRSVSPDLDAESLRVAKNFPIYQPARQNGKPVRVFYVVPVTFAIR